MKKTFVNCQKLRWLTRPLQRATTALYTHTIRKRAALSKNIQIKNHKYAKRRANEEKSSPTLQHLPSVKNTFANLMCYEHGLLQITASTKCCKFKTLEEAQHTT